MLKTPVTNPAAASRFRSLMPIALILLLGLAPLVAAASEPPEEPWDDWDELVGEIAGTVPTDGASEPPEEPWDEWDEVEWEAIPGYGLVAIRRSAGAVETRFYPLCPWLGRPELLEIRICAAGLTLGDGEATALWALLPELGY